MTVLEICHALHLSDTGQAELVKLAPESRKVMRAFLKERMTEWEWDYTDPKRLKFDRLVYQLCEAVLEKEPLGSDDPEYNSTGLGF